MPAKSRWLFIDEPLLFPTPCGRPSLAPANFLAARASLVRLAIRSRSISAAIAKAIAMILLWMLLSSRQLPFTA